MNQRQRPPLLTRVRARLRRFMNRIGGKVLFAALLALVVMGVIAAMVVYFSERGSNPEIHSIWSAFYWVAATFIDDAPFATNSSAVRFSYYTILLIVPAVFSLVTAAIASRMLQVVLRRNAGLGRVRLKDHMVILGWSGKGNEILAEIRRRDDAHVPEVVLLAPLDKNPSADPMVQFISGDPTKEEDLDRVSIRSAKTAVILADNSYPDIDVEDMDSRTLLTTLAVESMNPKCYTCVEVVRTDNAQHFNRTKANELVVSGRMTGALLAHSAVTHGLSKIIGDLITFPENNEFYWVDVPAELDGKTFGDGLGWMKHNHECLPIAVQQDGSHITNPASTHVLTTGQRLLVIAEEPPTI
jgi:voltage-gated potassium channel